MYQKANGLKIHFLSPCAQWVMKIVYYIIIGFPYTCPCEYGHDCGQWTSIIIICLYFVGLKFHKFRKFRSIYKIFSTNLLKIVMWHIEQYVFAKSFQQNFKNSHSWKKNYTILMSEPCLSAGSMWSYQEEVLQSLESERCWSVQVEGQRPEQGQKMPAWERSLLPSSFYPFPHTTGCNMGRKWMWKLESIGRKCGNWSELVGRVDIGMKYGIEVNWEVCKLVGSMDIEVNCMEIEWIGGRYGNWGELIRSMDIEVN